MDTTSEPLVTGLRELADFLDAHPMLAKAVAVGPIINAWATNKPTMAALTRELGRGEKHTIGNFFFVRRKFTGDVTLDVCATRATVCERVVVETRVVPEQVIPARAEEIVPAHTEEIVEWRCHPILADTPAPASDPEPVAA